MLDFSKIESGKMKLICDDYDFASLINDVVNMITPKADEKGLEFFVDVDETMPAKYYGDDTRIKFPSALIEGDTYESIADVWKKENYCLEGDPYGLQPVMPTEHELPNNKPYLDSNTITAFTVMDTNEGVVKSYYYDTVNTDNGVILFDKFDIKRKEIFEWI